MRYILLTLTLTLSLANPVYAYTPLAIEQDAYNRRSSLENDLFMQQEEMYELKKQAEEDRTSFERQQREQQQEIEDLKEMQRIKSMLR